MEDRFKKLDNFLREQLNGASEDHTWNVPDDAVFEKAMRTLGEQKKKKRRGWILIPVFIGVGLIASEYFHHQQIESLQDKITILEDKVSRESSATDPLSTTSTSLQDVSSASQASTSVQNQESNAGIQETNSLAASETSSNTQLTPSTDSNLSPSSNKHANQPTSKNQSLDKKSTNTKSITAPSTGTSKSSQEITSTTAQAEANEFSSNSGSDKPKSGDPSKNIVANSSIESESKTIIIAEVSLSGMVNPENWMTAPLSPLEIKPLETPENVPFVMAAVAANPVGSLQKTTPSVPVMHYGLLLGGNQSWLTMTNIPPGSDALLYNYDNSQPGFSMQGFVNKHLSPKFSAQAGLGYDLFRNKSILEDQFLYDAGNVNLMPDGQSMYQTDYDVINPIGEYKMLLEFRASEQMHQNDTIVEYTNIEQTIHSVMLDLGIHYDLLTLNHVKISLGTGFGLGYIAGLKNEFEVSTYHNGILQKNQMETPDELNSVKKWYGQWLGNLNIGYYPNDRLGIFLSGRYNAGLSSIRDGGTANGPLTFLHSFGLSAGISNSF